jgi:CRISPR-associated protein Csm1
MSAQILLQGRLRGSGEFVLSPPADSDNQIFEARFTWLVLLGEVIPRALLNDLQLPPMMLGSAGDGEFVVILPDRSRADEASRFLARVSESLVAISEGTLNLSWSATENLGDWTIVRKRLQEGMRSATVLSVEQAGYFEAFSPKAPGPERIPRDLRDASAVVWSFAIPSLIGNASSYPDGGPRWDVGSQAAIPVTRHAARIGDGFSSPEELSLRSSGQKYWGVLRGEIDDFSTRLRRLQSVEEHVHVSTLYKQFLTGEIELLCSQGEYFQRVTILSAGAASFALYGSWDALAGFARELERVFSRFAEENLKDLPGAVGKSITMALTLADSETSLARAWEACGRDLEKARATDKDCLNIFGQVLEWKQLNDAAELKDAITRLNEEFRSGPQFLAQLRRLYRKAESGESDEQRLVVRAFRFQRHFARVATRREREFQKLRAHLMKELTGRGLNDQSRRTRLKLRPEGLIALEWARLAED